MNVYSIENKTIKIERELDTCLGDLLCTKDITIGTVVEIDKNNVEVKLFTDMFNFKIGINEEFFFQKKNEFFFVEYFNNILTPNGSLGEIKWETEFEFISILDEGCQVSSQDIIGYIKHNNFKYPILVPDGIVEGVLIHTSPTKVTYEQPINHVSYQGRLFPVFAYQFNEFKIQKSKLEDDNKLVLMNREFDSEVLKVLSNFDMVVHVSSKLPQSYIQNSITQIKEYFLKAGVNNVQVIGYNDYPCFNDEYTRIILEKVINNVKQVLLRGINTLIFLENFDSKLATELYALEGEYKTKSGKHSLLRIVELKH
jgi:hypothetical protein